MSIRKTGGNVVKQDYELILTSYPDCEDFVVEILADAVDRAKELLLGTID